MGHDLEVKMSTIQASDYRGVVDRVRDWSPDLRLGLAIELLRSLQPNGHANDNRGFSAAEVRGIGAGNGPPPDDETAANWLSQHRTEKHG